MAWPRPSPPTLAGRLTRWLVLLSLAVLGGLCIGIDLAARLGIEARQAARLEKTAAAVGHRLAEASERESRQALLHDLEDLLKVDHGLSLSLRDRQGDRIDLPAAAPPPAAARRLEIDVAAENPVAAYPGAVLTLDTSADIALLDRLATILWSAALIGSAIIVVGGYLVVQAGLSPVRRLVEQTRALAALSLDRRLAADGVPGELAALVEQFNALLERLEGAYRQLEGFNADVAHELRTPLATLIASGELALRGDTDAEELRAAIADSLDDLRRLSGIVSDMLFLSQADRGARARRVPVASLAALCAEVADYYDALAEENELRCTVDGDAGGAFDASLLRRALSNLLGNAIRHAERGSTIVLRIRTAPAGAIDLSVVNRGPAIDPDALPRIFDRFYRGEASRKGDGRHGLGLAIVAAIARMHAGTPFARSADGETEIGVRLSGE